MDGSPWAWSIAPKQQDMNRESRRPRPRDIRLCVRSCGVRKAFRCRAYPDEQQQAVLKRTFGCVRMIWNRTLAERHARWHAEHKSTSYAESDRALTGHEEGPELAVINEFDLPR
jgi:Helix-turn-helix domain